MHCRATRGPALMAMFRSVLPPVSRDQKSVLLQKPCDCSQVRCRDSVIGGKAYDGPGAFPGQMQSSLHCLQCVLCTYSYNCMFVTPYSSIIGRFYLWSNKTQ